MDRKEVPRHIHSEVVNEDFMEYSRVLPDELWAKVGKFLISYRYVCLTGLRPAGGMGSSLFCGSGLQAFPESSPLLQVHQVISIVEFCGQLKIVAVFQLLSQWNF